MRVGHLAACVVGLALASITAGKVTIETVPVGNVGNAGELSGSGAGGHGPDRICGAVDYAYNIGKYEVTTGQYTEFLNAVAGVDRYGLYNTYMWTYKYGCMIERHAGSGTDADPYQYRVAADWANRPVNYVSWADAARFANWLHNGQPTGAPDLSTTEDGAYHLNGATSKEQLLAVAREADWTWAIPSEDEWYKAGYYNPATGTYYDYPTGSDSVPSNDLIDPDPGNNANFAQVGFTIGGPYYRTEFGEFENSDSPYGTFDQGGNVREWNEAVVEIGLTRGDLGGGFTNNEDYMRGWCRVGGDPTFDYGNVGFRVSEVPEPATLGLLGAAVPLVLKRKRKSRCR